MIERRASGFVETLSLWLMLIAALGGFLVLLDPTLSGTVFGYDFKLGTGDFSSELKGAVVTTMLIGGWTAVIAFWLGASKGEERKAEALSRIAEASAPTAAAAAAAPTQADTVNVAAEQVNVTKEKQK